MPHSSLPHPEGAPGDQTIIAGYRIVRELGVGTRAHIAVARPAAAQSECNTVALKTFHSTVTEASIATEADVLGRVESEHVVKLIDVFAAHGSRCTFVLEHLPGGNMAEFLGRRSTIHAGEAVTLLTSIARAIDDLHHSGFAHGRITPRSVVLDGAGRPVLVGLGHVVDARLPAVNQDVFLEDYRQFRSMSETALAKVESEGREAALEALRSWISAADPENTGPGFAAELERELFALAQPTPLRTLPGSRLSARAASPSPGLERLGQNAGRSERTPLMRGGFPSMLKIVQNSVDIRPAKLVRDRVSKLSVARRRQLMFGGALAAVLAVVTLSTLTSGPPDIEQTNRAERSPAATKPPGATPGSTHTPAATQAADRGPDDPVEAVSRLLTIRARCLAEDSLSCLDLCNQAGSPLLETDQATIAASMARKGSGEPASSDPNVSKPGGDYSMYSVALADRAGNSALVSLAPPSLADDSSDSAESATQPKPASALIIKGEAGWLLREIFEN
jgi:eukaryotic-like serine/threonine-protein kinase